MSDRPAIPNATILDVYQTWKGNVEAAAQQLGIRPKSLRERLDRLGVDREAVRAGVARYVLDRTGRVVRVTPTETTGTGRGVRPVDVDPSGSKSAPRPVTGEAEASTLSAVPMQAAEVKDDEEAGAAPFRASPAAAKNVRVKPPFQERLRVAKIQVIRHLGIDTDEQIIHDQFCEEAFEPFLLKKLDPAGYQAWLRAQLDQAPAPPAVEVRAPAPKKAGKKDEGGGR